MKSSVIKTWIFCWWLLMSIFFPNISTNELIRYLKLLFVSVSCHVIGCPWVENPNKWALTKLRSCYRLDNQTRRAIPFSKTEKKCSDFAKKSSLIFDKSALFMSICVLHFHLKCRYKSLLEKNTKIFPWGVISNLTFITSFIALP